MNDLLREPGRALGVRMTFANATPPEEIEGAVEMLVAQGIGALYAGTDLLFALYGPKIVPPLAARFKLPAIYHMLLRCLPGGAPASASGQRMHAAAILRRTSIRDRRRP